MSRQVVDDGWPVFFEGWDGWRATDETSGDLGGQLVAYNATPQGDKLIETARATLGGAAVGSPAFVPESILLSYR